MKGVVSKIVEWAKERPEWQQEAIRRLWSKQSLDESDIEDLVELCKKPRGLTETRLEAMPLETPADESSVEDVQLESITHIGNVNALAPGQKISFGSNLTVVYGENGAGKSGYARILKSACRARGKEEIMGNVLSGDAPGVPSAKIGLSVEGNERAIEWHDDQPDPLLNNVSVFDSSCASVYLKDKTDVAYRPFGLDLFDQLSSACGQVRSILEKEKRALDNPVSLPELPPFTKAAKTLSNLSSLTQISLIKPIIELDEEAECRRLELQGQLKALAETDPTKAVKELELRADRLQKLGLCVASVEVFEPVTRLRELAQQLDEMASSRSALSDLQNEAYASQPLPGTGTEDWRQLWLAAERFSKNQAYVDQRYPVTEPEQRCLLCQQTLGQGGKTRLEAFAAFLASNLSTRTTELQASVGKLQASFATVSFDGEESTFGELALESKELGDEVRQLATQWTALVDAVAKASDPSELPAGDGFAENLGEAIEKTWFGSKGALLRFRTPWIPDRRGSFRSSRANLKLVGKLSTILTPTKQRLSI